MHINVTNSQQSTISCLFVFGNHVDFIEIIICKPLKMSGDIIENEEVDRDTAPPAELSALFSKKCNLLTESAVTLDKCYIRKLNVTESLNIAVGLEDNSIEVYKLNKSSLSKVCRLSGHETPLTEVVFSPKEDNLLYSAGHDGIKLWDIRTSGMCVQEYKDEEETPRPYDAMDISCTGRVICAGSQLVQEDAFLVFWDQRTPTPLGGYWNSHTDDITQVKFHKEKTEILATSSLDGLINIFDILESTEDEALTYSLNVENSVHKLSWLGDSTVSCVTQSNDVQLWDTSTGDMIKSFGRDKIAKSVKRLREDDCYVVDAFTDNDGNTVILAGSYGGDSNVLRSVSHGQAGKKLQPTTDFANNKQIVRNSHYDKQRDLLITTGESGLISVWSPEDSADTAVVSKKLNTSLKLHENRHKPY